MAPTRKSRSVNKRFSNFNEVSPDKDVGNLNKSRQRKRKFSDMLGTQWSKGELQRFYEAYRKFGKDWKKVASVVRNRSIEMVEALYNMNRAYLSLPEGTASVVGLIAMMTDHYNVLEESDSGREGNDAAGSQKFKKRGRGNVRLRMSKEDPWQSHSVPLSDGCLSILKWSNSDGRAVGKRTPRFPVSYSYKRDDREIYVLPSKRGGKLEANANDDDDDVAHVAALALTEASLRGSSPQDLQTSYCTKAPPIQGRERMRAQSKIAHGEPYVALTDEEFMEDSLGSKGAENGAYVRDSSLLADMGVGTVKICQMGKKIYGKNNKVEDMSNDEFGDRPEACSGTEGLDLSAAEGIVGIEITKAKFVRPSPPSQRKRSKKLYFGDENSEFDALQTLADLSLLMPTSTMEFDSSVAVKEDTTAPDIADKSSLGEAISSSHPREKSRVPGSTDKAHQSFSGFEVTTSIISKLVRDSPVHVPEEKLVPESTNKGWKRKGRSLASRALVEEESKSLNKGKRSSQTSALSKARPLEHSLSVISKRTAGSDTAVSTVQVPTNTGVILPTKQRSRRKKDPQRIWAQKGSKLPEKVTRDQLTPQDKTLYLKEKLSSLSSYMLRRWCAFEWFYSSIDYPWFAKNEFVEYLYHVGLGHIPRLTRVEWGVIRSSLGKPRRFSGRFLHEEKDKLKQYRESVRTHYTELRAGIKDGLPTDLARPLTVGQRVIALHPKTREVHDGSILTVDHDRCRVQFDRPEIGVEFVKDIDCMPSNPLENMPEALRRRHIAANKFYMESKELKVNGQSKNERSIAFDPNECPKNAQGHSYISSTNHPMNTLMKQMGGTIHSNTQAKAAGTDVVNTQQAANSEPCMVAQIQSKEADIRALSELTHSLHKEVSSDLVHLRQRNTYPGHSMPPWLKSLPVSSDSIGLPSSVDNSIFNSQDHSSNVVEIVKGSRIKAHAMVDAAIQALSSVKEGEDAFTRIGEALYSMNGCQLASDAGVSVMRSSDQVNGSLGHENHLTTCTSETLVTGHQSHLKSHDVADRNELQIPSELITSCVATLLTIQTCTERQYPPSDVAEILDSAVRSLHPSCPQNLPIYREIQMCMGRIKTQILALIPT